MKKLLLIVTLLLVWAPGRALADYDARKSEALAELDKSQASAEERAVLKPMLERYFSAREDCLEALVDIVEKTDKSEQDAMFTARAFICGTSGAQIINDGFDDIKDPSIGALGFVNVFASHEAAFYQSLATTSVAEARDQIVVIRINLADMTEVLHGKWQTILGEDKSLDERAKQVTDEIREDYKNVLREAAEAHPDMAETLAEQVKKLAESELTDPNTPSPTVNAILTFVKTIAVPLITLWQSTNTRMGARANSYRALFASEIRVLVMFEDVREDVKEFLEDNDWPRAEAEYAKAKSSLDTFVSNAKTSGQSSDASELRGDLMEQLAIHLKSGADVYQKFVSENRGRFEGALGPDIKAQLVEHDEWEKYATYIEGYGLDAKLREWHQHGTNYFNVDLSALSSKRRDELKTGLREIIEQLLKELKVAEEAGKVIEKLIEEEREDVEEKVD